MQVHNYSIWPERRATNVNVTNFINAISRELDKETKKEIKHQLIKGKLLACFSARDVRNLFDRAALTVATREFDKFRKEGAKKV